MRPVLIQSEENQWRTWFNITHVINKFNENEKWKNKRNKVITLREKLREGKDAVKQFITAYQMDELPHIHGGDESKLKSEGWTEEICGYFDAIEAIEFYFSLPIGDKNDCL